ncbi:MAG: hypothetical protein HY699_10340 [Deltaproteobacteria bacterium]|nr:hypothetical protein [Deltaproteobacteria bacterium]
MSQRQLESILGRMVTDAAFRERFFTETTSVCREYALELTADEVAALLRIDLRALGALAHRLDPKIVRAWGGAPVGRLSKGEWRSGARGQVKE